MDVEPVAPSSHWARALSEVEHGSGAVASVPAVIHRLNSRKVLLVTGRRSFEGSGAAAIVPALEEVAKVVRWSGFGANPDVRDLDAGLAVIRATSPDVVLGIGGGSVMDMAKLLCAFERTVDGSVADEVRAGTPILERRVSLVLVPTTSGSGSEATHFAVVYIGDEKFSVAGPAMKPDEVVLDPGLTLSAPPLQRASSGIDAVCQAIESMWATGGTIESQAIASEALDFLMPNIVAFVDDPSPGMTAERMCAGSHLAGRAIDISKTTAAHALSYAITKRHGVPHGNAVALTLGAFIEAHAGIDPSDLQPGVDPASHAASMRRILGALGAANGSDARVRWIELLERIGLVSRLAAAGVDRSRDVPTLAASVNIERLNNNPVMFDPGGLEAILQGSI